MAFAHRTDLLTTGAAARLLGVSQDTVARWVRSGKLPNQPTAKGHARIPRDVVMALRDGVSEPVREAA